MEQMEGRSYDPKVHITAAQIPDNTITIIIKSGGHAWVDGRNLDLTQENTVKIAQAMSQRLIDTIDVKGLKYTDVSKD